MNEKRRKPRRKVEYKERGKKRHRKERLKRIGSEKTKMKKYMLHLENR